MEKLNKQQAIHLIQEVKDSLKSSPSQRFGQTIFNVGVRVYPEIFEEIRATNLDPFYNDLLIPNLIEAICEPDGVQVWYESNP